MELTGLQIRNKEMLDDLQKTIKEFENTVTRLGPEDTKSLLQKQIKEQYTQKTLVLNATTQIDTNMKEKDKSMNNIVNKDTQYITDTVNNNLILDPHSDIETIKDIFNSISNTKISSHTKQMLQIIFNSYSNLKKENESLKQKLNQIEKEENE